jgi:hypothetical protein
MKFEALDEEIRNLESVSAINELLSEEYFVTKLSSTSQGVYIGLTRRQNESFLCLVLTRDTSVELPTLEFIKLKFYGLRRPFFRMSTGEKFAVESCLVIELPYSERTTFARLAGEILSAVGRGATGANIEEIVRAWADVLGPPTSIPASTVLGLWGELVEIYIASDPDRLVEGWHVRHDSKFDFDLGDGHVLEVKTSSSGKRRHHFSDNQINSNTPSGLVLSSMLTLQSDLGASVNFLKESIIGRLQTPECVVAFVRRVNKVCPPTASELESLKWSLDLAVESRREYRLNDLVLPQFEFPIVSAEWIQEFS